MSEAMSNEVETVGNLIDLSIEGDISSPITTAHPSNTNTPSVPQLIPLIPIAFNSNESLDNNPFDCIQNQADRPDDPFEIISREASFQPAVVNGSVKAEVSTGNLLWISDESIKVDDPPPIPNILPEFSKLQVPSARFSEPICSVSSIESASCSPCEDSAFTSGNDSSKTVNKAFITDNTINTSISENSRTQSIMNKGFIGSCSSLDVSRSSGNSTPECAASGENTDSSGKVRSQKATDARKRLLKISLTNSTQNSPLPRRPLDEDHGSPLSSVYSEAENIADRFTRFAVESAKSFDDSCDDLMSIKPNWIDSETDIDSDLEMMKIPILQEIPSPVVPNEPTHWNNDIIEEKHHIPVLCKNSPDLEALKEKVQQHKAESNNNNQEISALIANLKQVIKDSVNDAKKAEANVLLESLSKLVNDKKPIEEKEKMDTLTPPQPIVRQGTFDIDLKENEEREKDKENSRSETHSSAEPPAQHDDVFDKSSEGNISGGTHSILSPDPPQPEVSDIMEQIGRLLANQSVNVVQANLGVSGNGTTNPTYIVVMNTPIQTKHRPSIDPSEYINDGSPELNYNQTRRRSQSLSIHDKDKHFAVPGIVQSPQRNECKTPARGSMMRRNSFSNAMPSTPSTQSGRRPAYGAGCASETIAKAGHMQRRSMALATHHEKQHMPQPHPTMQMGGLNFNAKKLKFKQSTESIVKASGPMKATIPVKKVAPLIVTTNVDSPVEESNSNFRSATSTPNVQLAPSKGYPSACSTPMIEASPIKRSGVMKSRYSFVSAAPTPKSSTLSTSSNQGRRRTISELRSPKKTSDRSSVSGISKPGVKTVKLPQDFSKSLNKMAPTTSRGVLRVTKPSSATSAAKKDKENKTPKPGV